MFNQKKYDINPELKLMAVRLPFNINLLKIAAVFQTLLLKITPVPKAIKRSKYSISGYDGLPLDIEVYEPKNSGDSMPCLLYIHGGGFGYKAAPHQKKLAYMYAQKVNCKVVFPDYHLLPKYKFPAAYIDILETYKWMLNSARDLNIDQSRIGVSGDSAGGALTANLCNTYEKFGLTAPCIQLLIYPVTDALMNTKSMQDYIDTPLWNTINNQKMWSMYLNHATPEEIKQASPMQNDLPSKIPPAYIETAEFDCLHDEDVNYAERLKAAGGSVELYHTKGTMHGYDCAIKSKITLNSINNRIAVLKRAFYVGS